jgi:hypothetical protein
MSRRRNNPAPRNTAQPQPYNRRAYLVGPGTGGAGNSRQRGNPNIYPGESAGGPPPKFRQVVTPQRRGGRQPWADTGGAQDNVIVQDRHPYVAFETEITGRDSGLKDPIPDGPVRQVIRMLCRDWTMWQGSDNTAMQDVPRDYNRYGNSPTGQYIGFQDGTVTTIFGGQRGYFRPYGTLADTADVPAKTEGSSMIPAGPPHGLHTYTVQSRKMTLKSYRVNQQQVPGRQDRLSNSRRAGQSYSQSTQQQGAQ